MKRTLSLILAVVMVVLMIPFAAFVTSATDDASSEIVLPENWRMSADDGAGVANAWDENGVTLGSAGQYVQMTTTEGMGIGTKRVLAIDYGVATKVQRLRIAWEPDANTAPQDAWHNGSDIDLLLCGGPTEQSNGEDAKTCIKFCKGTGYDWNANGRYVNVTVTKIVDDESVTTTSRPRAWKADTETDFMKVLFDGANKGTGTKMMIYLDIDENNKVTCVNQVYVYHDENGNFVSKTVIELPIDTANTVVCDGYLTISHMGWGDNCAATVKAVDVYAGTYAEMGESIYSVNFAKKENVDENEYNPIYSIDFTEIKDPRQLAAAGWYTKEGTAKGSFESDLFIPTAEGVEFHTYSKNYFALGAVEFNDTDDYVVEFTTKMLSVRKRLIMAFANEPTDGNSVGSYDSDNWCLRDDKNSSTGNLDYGLSWKGANFYSDATYSTVLGASLRDNVSEEVYNAVADNADVTIKIFVTAGTANYIVMSVEGFGDFYAYDEKVAFGTTFHFTSRDSNGADRYVVLQDFTVYQKNAPAVTEKACVTAAGANMYYDAGTEFDASKLTGVVAVKVDGQYVAPAAMTLEAGKTYELATAYEVSLAINAISATTYRAMDGGVDALRFTTKFDADGMQKLVDFVDAGLVKSVELGTLITTDAWVAAAGNKLTFEALDALTAEGTDNAGKTAYVAVKATVGEWYAENTFAGSIAEVSATRTYNAVGFAKITLNNDTVVTIYTSSASAANLELAKLMAGIMPQ